MLKWIPREKKKDASVDISDDPLDALMFGKKDPHNKIYCVNRYVSRQLICNQESTWSPPFGTISTLVHLHYMDC